MPVQSGTAMLWMRSFHYIRKYPTAKSLYFQSRRLIHMRLLKNNSRLDSALVPHTLKTLLPLINRKSLINNPLNLDLARIQIRKRYKSAIYSKGCISFRRAEWEYHWGIGRSLKRSQ